VSERTVSPPASRRALGPASLAAIDPALAAEWHPTKNSDLTPRAVVPGSTARVWWLCTKDPEHAWPAAVRQRTKGTGCPFCAGKRVTPAGSLAAYSPEAAAKWHPTLNGRLTPDQVTRGSGRKVWWRCDVDPQHVWQGPIHHVVKSGRGCPFCAGKHATPKNSLAECFPAIAREWHPTLNGDLGPDDVTWTSGRRVVWRCRSCRHVFESVVQHRAARDDGCPSCSGRQVTPKNSLRALFPALAREWHPTRNGAVTPDDVTSGSSRRVFWQCPRDRSHAWQAAVSKRTRRGDGCPFCSRARVSRETSFAALHPRLAREWHPAKNAPLMPHDVLPGSDRKVWWRCTKDTSHVWQAALSSRTGQGLGCPICSGRKVTSKTSLAALHPRLARQWHRAKNAPLTPREVRPGSSRKVWWRCGKNPSHEWQATVVSRARAGHGCPICRGRVATPETSLRARFPAIARQWHPAKNRPLTPDDVVPGSNKRVFWVCPIDRSHVWAAAVIARTKGSGCPMCSGRIATPKTSLRRVFPAIARQWHPTRNGPLTPDELLPGSGKRVWWVCPLNRAHIWATAVNVRTRGHGCPMCGWARAGRRRR
jgi:hypothetical protein